MAVLLKRLGGLTYLDTARRKNVTGALGLLGDRVQTIQIEQARMQHGAISQSRAHRAMQPVFEVENALPLDCMGEEVAVKRGIL
jgi:hypothetical protein